jgi:hypothetical protein
MTTLIEDSVSLPDMIAVFLGILELVKMRRLVLVERDDYTTNGSVYGIDAEFAKGEEIAEDAASLRSDFDTPPDSIDKEVNNHAE